MKKCHLAAQVCLRREGCPLGLRADSWVELLRQIHEAQDCGEAGPPIPSVLYGRSLTPALLDKVARRPSEREKLLRLWERHQPKGGDVVETQMMTQEPAPTTKEAPPSSTQ